MAPYPAGLPTGLEKISSPFNRRLMGCYFPSDIIYLHAMKSFSCLFPYIKLLLRGQDVFLQVCWQPCYTSFKPLSVSCFLCALIYHIRLWFLFSKSQKSTGATSGLNFTSALNARDNIIVFPSVPFSSTRQVGGPSCPALKC